MITCLAFELYEVPYGGINGAAASMTENQWKLNV